MRMVVIDEAWGSVKETSSYDFEYSSNIQLRLYICVCV